MKKRVGGLDVAIQQVRNLKDPDDAFYPKSLEKGLRSERALRLLDEELERWCNRPIGEIPYLILNARCEKVRHAPYRQEAENRLGQTVERYRKRAPGLAEWAEENIPEGFTVFDLPAAHRRRLRTTNGLERISEEIKRRTRVARLFPNEASLLRLVSAVLSEISEEWETGRVYLNMKNERPATSEIYRKEVA